VPGHAFRRHGQRECFAHLFTFERTWVSCQFRDPYRGVTLASMMAAAAILSPGSRARAAHARPVKACHDARMSRPCAAMIALWICAGCGSPGPARPGTAAAPADAAPAEPPPLDRDYPRLAERAASLYEEIAAAFGAAGEDCPRATARLGELTAAYRDV